MAGVKTHPGSSTTYKIRGRVLQHGLLDASRNLHHPALQSASSLPLYAFTDVWQPPLPKTVGLPL